MNKRKIRKIARKFQKKVQQMVDESPGISSVSIEIGGEKIVIAQKKRKK